MLFSGVLMNAKEQIWKDFFRLQPWCWVFLVISRVAEAASEVWAFRNKKTQSARRFETYDAKNTRLSGFPGPWEMLRWCTAPFCFIFSHTPKWRTTTTHDTMLASVRLPVRRMFVFGCGRPRSAIRCKTWSCTVQAMWSAVRTILDRSVRFMTRPLENEAFFAFAKRALNQKLTLNTQCPSPRAHATIVSKWRSENKAWRFPTSAAVWSKHDQRCWSWLGPIDKLSVLGFSVWLKAEHNMLVLFWTLSY